MGQGKAEVRRKKEEGRSGSSAPNALICCVMKSEIKDPRSEVDVRRQRSKLLAFAFCLLTSALFLPSSFLLLTYTKSGTASRRALCSFRTSSPGEATNRLTASSTLGRQKWFGSKRLLNCTALRVRDQKPETEIRGPKSVVRGQNFLLLVFPRKSGRGERRGIVGQFRWGFWF
jgi:hypothetical protein